MHLPPQMTLMKAHNKIHECLDDIKETLVISDLALNELAFGIALANIGQIIGDEKAKQYVERTYKVAFEGRKHRKEKVKK